MPTEQEIKTALDHLHAWYGDARENKVPRKHCFLPYLLLRSYVNDRGKRPIRPPSPMTPLSPDIVLYRGTQRLDGSQVQTGDTLKIAAHVWNLGMAPVASGTLAFYVAKVRPATDRDATLLHAIRLNLPPRSSLRCHALFACPGTWKAPQPGTYYLIARAFAFGDMLGPHPWDYTVDRHVGIRQITVLGPEKSIEFGKSGVTQDRILTGNEYASLGVLLAGVPLPPLNKPAPLAITPQGGYQAFSITYPTLTANPDGDTKLSDRVRISFTAPVQEVTIDFIGNDTSPYKLEAYRFGSNSPDSGSPVGHGPSGGGEAQLRFDSAKADIDHVVFGCEGVATRIKAIRWRN
jgi:hypothetical protein